MSDQVNEGNGQPHTGQPESKRERQKRRRQQQAAQQHQQQRRQRRKRGLLTAVVVVVAVAAVLGLAVLIAGGDGGDGSGDGTSAGDVPAATVDGSGLSQIPESGEDPAVGQDAPEVTGQNFAGGTTTLGTDGDGAQAIVLVAHWCPHCQAEIPQVVQWVEDGMLPSGVELVAVSTLHRPDQGNWPPGEWLADENWPGQVLADPDESVARAYGLAATPSWVFVDGNGDIAKRVSGRMSREELESTLSAISG